MEKQYAMLTLETFPVSSKCLLANTFLHDGTILKSYYFIYPFIRSLFWYNYHKLLLTFTQPEEAVYYIKHLLRLTNNY